MAEVAFLIRLEHRKLARLLDTFERMIRSAAARQDVDGPLLHSIAGYFAAYPGLCHHPKEDLIYRRLYERDAVVARAVGGVVEEHEQLERRSRDLTTLLAEGLTGEGIASPLLLAAAADYIARSRRHMAFEEAHFLPTAARVLSEDDWAEIDFAVFDHADPLFSEAIERRFEALRQDLLGVQA